MRYTLPHTSTDAYALIYKCFTHFGWCFCGRMFLWGRWKLVEAVFYGAEGVVLHPRLLYVGFH